MTQRDSIRNGLLVLRSQEGDGAAFADLVLQWQERLWCHAYRLTADRDAAADIVQESWLAVVKGLRGLQDVDLFPAWVFRIVTNKSRDWIRRQRFRRRVHEWFARDTARREQSSPARDQRVESLRAAMEHLSVDDRALITLYYQEGFSTQEIAGILGISSGTVKSRLYHARNKIRGQMEGFHHG